MRILADENVPIKAIIALRAAGHDVRQIARTPDAGLDDDAIWNIACSEKRLLLTQDRKFMRKRNETHFGMIVVRLSKTSSEDFSRRAMIAICEESPEQWPGLLIVVRNQVQTLYRAHLEASEE